MREYGHNVVELKDGEITPICAVPQDSSQVLVRNVGEGVVYLGGDHVDTETGFPLYKDDAPVSVPCFDSDTATLYGVAGKGVKARVAFIVSS